MADSCRICRGDESDGPLLHPCKCSGSIQFVHEDCLSDWLDHRHGQSTTVEERACELCGYIYEFKPIYSDDFESKSANLQVYFYRFWKSSAKFRSRFLLSMRALFSIILASLSMRFSYSYVTEVSDLFSRPKEITSTMMIYMKALTRALPTPPPFTPYLDFPFKNPIVYSCWSSFVNGFALLVITVFFILTIWMISIWTLQDPVLALETEQLLIRGIELNNIEDLQREIERVKLLVRDENVNPQARAHLLARLDNEINEDPAWMPNNERRILDHRHNAEVQRDQVAFEEEDGFWGVVDDLFGGPLLTRALGVIVTLALLNIVCVGCVFGLPYVVGRLLVKAIQVYLAPLGLKPFADSFELKFCTFLLGSRFILNILESPYAIFYDYIKGSERGRAAICTAKQLASIEKVWMFVTVEAVLFPLFCGFLLHIAFTPVMVNTSVVDAMMDVYENPRIYLFVQWAVGMSYMYTLCDFFKNCRTFLRPGVLYFVQDPSDPKNEPIRNFLSNSVTAHLRKITFSGMIYTILILAGIGSITSLFRWSGIVPVLIAPLDIKSNPGISALRYWYVPLAFLHLLKLGEGGDGASSIYCGIFKDEFKRASKWLGLGSFLFNEETNGDNQDGYYVRAPTKDNFIYPKGTKLFLPCDAEGKLLTPTEREMPHYEVVWRPKYFWFRVAGLILWIWAVSVALVNTLILTPLLVGRGLEYICMIKQPTNNDLVHYVGGAFVACLFAVISDRVIKHPFITLAYAMPHLILVSNFCYNLVDLLAQTIAPSIQNYVHPSEEKIFSLTFYAYIYYVFGTFSNEGLYMTYALAVGTFVLPPVLNLIVVGVYESYRLYQQNQQSIDDWRHEALKDYYMVREALLNYNTSETSEGDA